MQRNEVGLAFTPREIFDILVSWIALAVAYTLAFRSLLYIFQVPIGMFFLISMAVSGIQFVGHEMAHKFTAMHYGLEAHFRPNYFMILLGVLISISGILFFAPGAVVIESYGLSRRTYGISSMAGPLTNILVAGAMLPLFYMIWEGILVLSDVWALFIFALYTLNAIVALWNMLPFGPFDGRKILAWSPAVFTIMIVAAGLLTLVYYILVFF
jgi:Zn-dependent protease